MSSLADQFGAFPFPAEAARELDRICVEFESSWRRGESPELVRFLDRTPFAARGEALSLLLQIEIDARLARGESPDIEDYRARLGGLIDDLDGLWLVLRAGSPAVDAVSWPLPLPDRFELLEEIASGGMGTVYKARHRHLGRTVALKVLRRRLRGDEDASERFRNEIRMLASLGHPSISAAVDADFVDGFGVLVLEFIEGSDLQRVVREQGPLPCDEALRIARDMAAALQYAHDHGIVHRDVKPANVMRTPAGDIKLLDLGIAELSAAFENGDSGKPASRGFRGTPDFAAPEATTGETVDARADVYSLGCTLHFLLCGAAPFPRATTRETLEAHQAESPPRIRSLRPDVPEEIERLLLSMLAKNPEDRPRRLLDVAATIERVLSPAPPSRRRRFFAVAISAAAIAALIGAQWTFRAPIPASVPARTVDHLVNSIGMEFVRIAPDSTQSEQAEPLIGTREVTRTEFRRVMESETPAGESDESPLTNVDWHQASEFCRRLSGFADERRAGRRYRLPTESEWLTTAEAAGARRTTRGEAIRIAEPASANATARPELSRLRAGLLNHTWEWCAESAAGASVVEASPSDGEGLPARERHRVAGPSGFFLHNFDLYDDYRSHLKEFEGVRLRKEKDGRTLYFEPAAPRRDGRIAYAYDFQTPIREARLHATILAHESTSAAWLEVSSDGSDWRTIDTGYVSDAHRAPRDISNVVRGGKRIEVRLRIREETESTWLSQALRTSPNPDFQFPHVYQLLVVTDPGRDVADQSVIAPASLRHPKVGFRVVCETSPPR